MIDFICVSNRPEKQQKLAASIPLAIGDLSPWNLTVVDASEYDLFRGYNQGAAQTKGEILAFVHDDVQFLGNPLSMAAPLAALNDPQVGFVGPAGTRLLSRDAAWWIDNTSPGSPNCRGAVVQTNTTRYGIHANVWPEGKGEFGQVVVLDGVLLMCHRRTFERLNGFDGQTYNGFDFYDIDITFRASMEQLINLAAPILLLHDSIGATSQGWEANRQIFLKKFGHLLPARVS